ncbi:MAG: ABC transporter ATP-binding protein [Anaerolineae bacterium]
MADSNLLIEIKDLKTYFPLDEGTVKAVDGATFDIGRGETLGVVGESGCGKSMVARSILQIVDRPGRIVGGQILYHRAARHSAASVDIIDLAKLDPRGAEMRAIRGAEIAMIFQEPMTALSPVYTIGNQIIEAIEQHRQVTKREAREEAIRLLREVGMSLPERRVDEYPHQLSGGMRQRAMIAMALSCRPVLLIADEPTTALDVTTQAQILELMLRLKRDLGMGIMMITHDLGVIAEMAERVVVMYLGRVAEVATVRALFHDPKHPYTIALLNSIPKVGRRARQRLKPVSGMVPNPYNRPKGCLFHPRCPSVMPGVCDQVEPPLVTLPDGHRVACLLYGGPSQ